MNVRIDRVPNGEFARGGHPLGLVAVACPLEVPGIMLTVEDAGVTHRAMLSHDEASALAISIAEVLCDA